MIFVAIITTIYINAKTYSIFLSKYKNIYLFRKKKDHILSQKGQFIIGRKNKLIRKRSSLSNDFIYIVIVNCLNMKLTQIILFQCFEKSRWLPLATNSSTNKRIRVTIIFFCLDALHYEFQTEIFEQEELDTYHPHFALPVHIRQLNKSLHEDISLALNERKFSDIDLLHSNEEFYRICPTTVNNIISRQSRYFLKLFCLRG